MKIPTSLKKTCQYCKTVKRLGRVYKVCNANTRHKKRQGYTKPENECPFITKPGDIISEPEMPQYNALWKNSIFSHLFNKGN